MTHFCAGFGEAPVPTTVSSYSRPEGVFVIFDSFLSAVAAVAGAAGLVFSSAQAGSARDSVARHARNNCNFRIDFSLSLFPSKKFFFYFFRKILLLPNQSLPCARRGDVRVDARDVALRAQVNWCPLVVPRGMNVEDALPAVGGGAARGLRDEREGRGLVHEADLALRALRGGRVEVD